MPSERESVIQFTHKNMQHEADGVVELKILQHRKCPQPLITCAVPGCLVFDIAKQRNSSGDVSDTPDGTHLSRAHALAGA